jgi:8-oxo-dGTP pyrophosphatase MutT (NUDIX family)
VALREVREESGLESACPITDDPISLEILCVEGHVRKGVYVSCHLHLNLTYLVDADEEETLKVCEAENAALKWFSPDAAIEASTEPWFRRWVYPKLNDRLNEFR